MSQARAAIIGAPGRSPERLQPPVAVVFDGLCGFCTRCVEALARLDRHGQVRCWAAQEPGVRHRYRLTTADTAASAWTIDAAGHRFAGAAAVTAALAAALEQPVLLTLYRIPPIRIASELAYRWIAANRRRFPGVTPYCRQPGADCAGV